MKKLKKSEKKRLKTISLGDEIVFGNFIVTENLKIDVKSSMKNKFMI